MMVMVAFVVTMTVGVWGFASKAAFISHLPHALLPLLVISRTPILQMLLQACKQLQPDLSRSISKSTNIATNCQLVPLPPSPHLNQQLQCQHKRPPARLQIDPTLLELLLLCLLLKT